MSNGYQNGAFALGLITGLGMAVNLFLWVDLQARREKMPFTGQGNSVDFSHSGSIWDGLLGTFVSPSDTLAQWIMTVFTIAAVVFVALTYIVTRRMAEDSKAVVRDTREIGEKQVRAYVSVQSAYGQSIPGENGTRLVVVLKNTGASPAFGLNIRITNQLLCSFSQKSVWFEALADGQLKTDLGAGETRTVYCDRPDIRLDAVEWINQASGERLFCFLLAEYSDAFNRKRRHRTLLSAEHTGRHENGNLVLSACPRGNRSS
jgi:hypothetical protein